jgi:predicted outer membrane repeat protein
MKSRPLFLLLLALAVLLSAAVPAAAQEELPQAVFRYVDYRAPEGLVAYWKFDEAGSTTLSSFPGITPQATISAGASISPTVAGPTAFPNAGALFLNGNSNIVSIPDNAAAADLTNLGTELTIAAWVKRSFFGGIDTIYVNGETTPGFWHLAIMGDHSLAFRLATSNVYSSTVTVPDLTWHHVAATLTAGKLDLYIDGGTAGSYSGVVVPAVTLGDKYIGSRQSAGARFPGHIDELRIYNRALPLAEIKRLASGRGCALNGLSWATAFFDLQCALAEAKPGDDIWIADGAYRPGVNRSLSYNIPDGVDLVGGFNGNETALNQRPPHNPTAPITYLSGDILGDDIVPGFTNRADNSYHVVRIAAGVDTNISRLGIAQGSASKTTAPAENTGGGLKVEAAAGVVYLDEVSFFFNQAADSGGAIHSGSPLTFNLGYVGYNQAASFGGGIYTTAPLTILGGHYFNNSATSFYGGAISAGHTLHTANARFQSNQAAFGGGAISGSTQPITITASTFMTNTAVTYSGGAIETSAGLFVSQSAFQGNQASFSGGAIQAYGDLTVLDSNFSGNQAIGANCLPVCSHGSGGAIYTQGSLSVNQGSYTGNTARLHGGAIYANGPSATIVSVTTADNKAGYPSNSGNPNLGDGGAIYSEPPISVFSSSFTNNSAKQRGGGIFSAEPLEFSGGTFNTNSATQGGGLYLQNGGSLSDSGLGSNRATTQGGGIFLQDGSLSLGSTLLAGNFIVGGGGSGGGIYMQNGNLTGSPSLSFNQAGSGGGIFQTAGSLSLDSATFTSNNAVGGGAIFQVSGTLSLSATSLISNTAGATGGGAINATGILTDTNGIYRGNTSSFHGGAVLFEVAAPGARGTFSGSTFSRNQATDSGGGLYSAAPLALNQVSVISNTVSTGGGGGVYVSGIANLSGGLFQGNTAFTDGGGLFQNAGALAVSGTAFTNNKANGGSGSDGGGIFASGGTSTITNATFTGNSTVRNGGGARLINSTLSGALFQNNQSTAGNAEGGALFFSGGDNQVIASIFRGNSSSLSGAISGSGTCANTLLIANSLFFDNTAGTTAGVSDLRLFDLATTLTNNTFGRSGNARASAVFFRCSATATNSIWVDYPNSLVLGVDASPAVITEDYNQLFNAPLSAGIPPGAKSQSSDPLFTNPAANLFTLKAGSPAIDSGSNAALPAGLLTDLAGSPRVIGGTVDRGAYEALARIWLPWVSR